MSFLSLKATFSRFTDREIFQVLDKQKIGFFNRVGGAIRKTARRTLRQAPQKKRSDLTNDEKKQYEIRLWKFQQGLRKNKPRRPDRTAQRGNPPLLHMKKSPLKELLLFSVDQKKESVVVGPAQFKNGNLQPLENGFPFMEPSFKKIEPQIPQYLAAARSS
jgi:hypothetical protein